MINTQYGSLITPTTAEKTGSVKLVEKEEAVNNEATKAAVLPNVDRFEHSTTKTADTYSPTSIGKDRNAVYSITSSASQATTDFQLENIPLLLATKMAGLSTNPDGTPKINSNEEYQRLQAAQNTIYGNHPKLSYKKEYCYSQLGYSYGNPNPKKSCCVFSFATALSIKYGKQITPADIKTKAAGWIDDLVHITPSNSESLAIKEWKYDSNGDGGYDGTAYRICNSSGEETLRGIDAQLQLGNPVLIHVKGKDSSGAQSEHWATVIGKKDGEYTIIDPWGGDERSLDRMEIYWREGSTISDYVILTNEY